MSRITESFKKKKLFIGYLTAGDGDSPQKFRTLLDGGVDLLEIGIPFSDPVADGPVIQQAMVRALEQKTNVIPKWLQNLVFGCVGLAANFWSSLAPCLRQWSLAPDAKICAASLPKNQILKPFRYTRVLELVKNLRSESEVPIVLFTYFNPIQRGLKEFLTEAKVAGVDGILVVDLPPEEAAEYQSLCLQVGLDPIFVVAPSTPPDRIKWIATLGRGFIYYACRKGTTGTRVGLPEDLEAKIALIRKATDLPIAVGFGISDPKTARQILEIADAFVVGSYFVEEPKRVYDFRS